MYLADSKTKDRLQSLPFATLSLGVDIIQGESEFLADLGRVVESYSVKGPKGHKGPKDL